LQVAAEAKKCVVYTSHFQLTSVAEVEIIALALRPIFSRLVLMCTPFSKEEKSLTMMPQGSAIISTVDSSRTFVCYVAVVAASHALPLVFCSNCLPGLFWRLRLGAAYVRVDCVVVLGQGCELAIMASSGSDVGFLQLSTAQSVSCQLHPVLRGYI